MTAAAPASRFDLEDIRPRGLTGAVGRRLLARPQWWMGLLRRHWPIARLPFTRWALVTRFEDVQEVLARDAVFEVPFAGRMRAVMPGPLFVLALPDGPEYCAQRRHLMQAFRLEDTGTTIAPRAAALAEAIVAGSGGQLDAIESLLTRVPTLLCQEYYGVEVPDPRLFAHWLIAVSAYLFGPPSDRPNGRGAATAAAAAAHLRPLLEAAIQGAKASADRATTIVARLVGMQEQGGGEPSDELIRAELFGMLTGFVPTNTIASGNALAVLLDRPDVMREARAAALADDDERLWRCLLEAMRFRPINPGPYRRCATDYTLADGSARGRRIPAGTWVLASTQSAMFDERSVVEPRRFRPERRSHESMVFGYGLHWCIGAFLAKAQITQTFKPLLRRARLRPAPGRAGRLQTIGSFPLHLGVEFDP